RGLQSLLPHPPESREAVRHPRWLLYPWSANVQVKEKSMSRLRSWPLVALLVLLGTALTAIGCGDDNNNSSSKGDLNTIAAGKLRVGSDIPYAPFEFGRDPDYQGFDVDIVNEVAKRLELDATFVKTPFDPI